MTNFSTKMIELFSCVAQFKISTPKREKIIMSVNICKSRRTECRFSKITRRFVRLKRRVKKIIRRFASAYTKYGLLSLPFRFLFVHLQNSYFTIWNSAEMDLTRFSQCVEREFALFETKLREYLPCFDGTMGQMSEYVLRQKGKRLRPLISFLTAKTCGEVNEATYRAAVVLELLHTASLVHDDVLDESNLRRNLPTANNIWGNKAAILFGDYIYGKCLQLIETKEDFELLSIYSKVARELPQGELLQKDLSEAQNHDINSYFAVIDRKTASMFGAAAFTGAKTACRNASYVEAAEQFGRLLGRAFQIKDDILDFDTSCTSGKGFGNDIKEKKITLPVIFWIDTLGQKEKEELLAFVAKDKKSQQEILSFVERLKTTDCLNKAGQQVGKYSSLAKEQLKQLPDNEYRKQLEDLTDCLVERDL